ncbi:hypothetical protein F5X68DRAFT_164799 [Plectosphaerella plurivora]|uniref:DUF6987 domain-containing protein n=1 Tax=Plectosphaerella plurivora TaxID=936078 RepID=A0A9P8VKA6_9PEZI|nr:hypothetical protein F5X68DRAFT_164799 [Plectosphaerella plurivora]
MLGSAGKKLNKAAPGGGGEQRGDAKGESLGNLAAGIVGKTGEVVDDTGNTVGKITEGTPADLVGNVVTATGDIVGKDGGIVGKALPVDEEGEETKEGWSIMGAAKSVKGVIDVADGTIQTVNRAVPIVGDITKGLSLGGDSSKGSGLLGGLLGTGSSERDPEEREKITEAAKKDLFEDNDKTSEVAPIDLQDQEKAKDDARLEVETKSQPPDSDTDSKTQLTEESTDVEKADDASETDTADADDKVDAVKDTTDDATEKAGDATEKADDTAAPVKETAEEATDKVDDTVEETKDKADDTTADVTDKTEDVADDATEKAQATTDDVKSPVDEKTEGVADEAKSTVDDTKSTAEGAVDDNKSTAALDDTKSTAEGAVDDTKSTAEGALDDTKSTAEGAVDETKSTAEGAADEAKSTAEGAADEAKSTAEGAGSQLDEIETVRIEGDKIPAPFEKFEGAEIDDEGKVMFEEGSIGKVVEGDPEQLAGAEISPEGLVLNENGSEIGRVELKSEIAEELQKEAEEAMDLSVLKGTKVNKGGNLVNDKNEAVGRVVEGILKNLIGRKADDKGQIWNDRGEVIGRAEIIPEKDRQDFKEPSPFEDFPDATVQSNGEVHNNGDIVGRLIEGDGKKLKGKKVDEDGDVLDKQGNKIGKAERWEPEPEPEAEPEPEVDKSALAGKRVNKAGNVVDSSGTIFGRVIEGDPKRMNGRMCNKNGEILSESGDVIGRAELVPEGEREGLKEGPFAELSGCTVAKDGTVVTPSGDIVGRLTSGDGKKLFGREVDEDGDVLDRNGNQIGKAERWEAPEEEAKPDGPLKGYRVNKKGEVYDKEGNLIAKLTSGDLSICSGKEIDNDNDVVDSKGNTIGHVTLVEDIPEPEPEPEGETEEEKKAREAKEKEDEAKAKDEKLAKDLGALIEQSLDKVRPICKMITEKIDKAERTPKEELDEEELVKQVKPLIEEGGRILSELNGTVRALDPDGRIQRNAKHKSSTREASPAEHHLAEQLKELTGTVTQCIDGAKKKLEDMPHAKKELNPLWGLLTEPLFQILAAVGLLLTGVLNLVGRLLHGLGLGGLVDGLLGSLGLNRLLDGLGLGSLTNALTGKKNKK